MSAVVEVLADDDVSTQRPDVQILRWPSSGSARSDTVDSELGWRLAELGSVGSGALDLARIAGAAYLADRSVRRSTTYFSRHLELIVHLDNPDAFLSPAGQRVADLLGWLTGDAWTITPVANGSTAQPAPTDVKARDTVQLMSGGLDSLCAAVIDTPLSDKFYLGHRDRTGAVAKAQSALARTMQEGRPEFDWLRVRFAPTVSLEPSTRTRSLLFMTLAVAAASARGATVVVVPENGFTSANLPLLPSRGGALSTKSTHPWTFMQINQVMDELQIGVHLTNPYALQTKGEMLTQATAVGFPAFTDLVKESISCGKMDGGMAYKGGNPNLNCGLCIACLVRRGAFVGSGITDPTTYLIDILVPDVRRKLVYGRRSDVWAVQSWGSRDPTVDDLMVSAPWPSGTDYETMLDTVRRGRLELLGALDVAL